MAPILLSGSGLAFAEDRCPSTLCRGDSYTVTILSVIILETDVTSLSVTTPLVKGGGEGMGTGGTALLRNDGTAEALLMVVVSCDRLNSVVPEAVVFPRV